MSQPYDACAKQAEFSIRIEASRFLAFAIPLENADDAQRHLAALKKKYFDATHCCYGYVLGESGGEQKSSDAGEPHGTAGIRILQAIESQNISDVLVVVVRYYGGTKLGTGRLGRAYFEAAKGALEQSPRNTKQRKKLLLIRTPYDNSSIIISMCSHYDAQIQTTQYDKDVVFHIAVSEEREHDFKIALLDKTRGNARIDDGGFVVFRYQQKR